MVSTPQPEHDENGAATSQPQEAAAPAARRAPTPEEIERIAVDVRIRRRPRYGAFIAAGTLLAGLVAFLLAVRVPQDAHANWAATVWVITIGAMVLGALLGAVAGVLADGLSRRRD